MTCSRLKIGLFCAQWPIFNRRQINNLPYMKGMNAYLLVNGAVQEDTEFAGLVLYFVL
jgi:hypothetical protein